jgi:KAP family P-loop domain
MGVAKPHADPPIVGHPHRNGTQAGGDGSAPPEAPLPAEVPASRWLYADKPLEYHPDDKEKDKDKDSLGFGAYADALAMLIDQKDTSTPLTLAINGPWGSGKTSLAKMAEARLSIGSDWDASHVICWFDAWANDDAPHLGAAFASAVAKAVNKQRYWWWRLVMPLPSVMLSPVQRWRRRLWFGLLSVALAAAAIFWPTGRSLLTPLLHPGVTVSALDHGSAATRLAWPVLAVAVVLLAQRLGPGIQGIARWIDNPGSEAARGSVQEASQQLGRLIRQALRQKRRLVIFVDNLERCRPPRAVEVCEVVSQLIGHPQVVTVLIGNMDTIALSAEIKYAALETISSDRAGTLGPRNPVGAYGRAYLEKLVQIQISLPPPLPSELRRMLVPIGNEPWAFPQDARDPKRGILARAAQKAAALGPSGLVAVSGSIAAIGAITIATLGTDALFGAAGVTAAAITAIVQRAIEGFEERRKRQTRTVIDEAVSSEVKTTETILREDGIDKLAQDSNTDARDVGRRWRQRIISHSDLRTELDRAVQEVLPLSPRGAKRMFNHAHLLLDIGFKRGIFAEQSGLKIGQLAEWVALTERWPSVAAAISSDPTLTGRLEVAARRKAKVLRPEQLIKLENKIGISGLDSSLLEYLCRCDSLVPVVHLLVNFALDADGASAPLSATHWRRRLRLLRQR